METKIYQKKSEKIIDFLIGFLLIPIVGIVSTYYSLFAASVPNSSFLYTILFMIVFGVEIVLTICLGVKRKFIGIGLLYALVAVPLVLLGTCLVAVFGGSFIDSLFRR